jgi:hypothetical protein
MTQEDQSELQTRLGRYLNTFLVISGEYLYVTLNPLDDYCGLPNPLRYTELERDLLAQDIVLKNTTAALIHPETDTGKIFWAEFDRIAAKGTRCETCIRVWIVPSETGVTERSDNGYGHVEINTLRLKVLSESDYHTLSRYRSLTDEETAGNHGSDHDKHIHLLFKEVVLPKIQEEVSIGPRFGLLRQIESILIVAKWIMESQLGPALKQAGFLGSNDPEKYGLNRVADEQLRSMKQMYIKMFGEGTWHSVRTHIDITSGRVSRRLYVAGGIDLNDHLT